MKNKQGLFLLITIILIILVATGLFIPRQPDQTQNIQYIKAMELIQDSPLGKMSPKAQVDISTFIESAIPYLSFQQGQDPMTIAKKENYLEDILGDNVKRNDALSILFKLIGVKIDPKTDLLDLAISHGIISEKDKSLKENNKLSASEASYLIVSSKASWYERLENTSNSKEIDPSKSFNKAKDFLFSGDGNILWYKDEGDALNAIYTEDGTFSSEELPIKEYLNEYQPADNQKVRNIHDNQGILRVVELTEEKKESYISDKYILYRDTDTDEWKKLIEFDLDDYKRYEVIGFSEDNEKIYVKTNFYDNYIAIYEINPVKQSRQVIYKNKNADVIDRLIADSIDLESTDFIHPSTGKLLSTTYIDDKPRLVCLDKDFQSMMKLVEEDLGANTFPILGSWDLRYLVVLQRDDTNLGSYYLYNTKTRVYHLLAHPSIDPDSIGVTLPVSFKASYGESIFAYLTLPKGKAPENLNLIINVHKGPFSRFSITPNPQTLVAIKNGYAVLSVNGRMSTGYGLEYIDQASKDLMLGQKDIYEAAKWAIENKIASSQKLGIMGEAYGGFSAFYQAAAYPDIYKIVISTRGVWDWNKLSKDLLDEDLGLPFYYKHFAPAIDSELESILSPSKYADRIKGDFLIISTDKDYDQSDEAITDLTLRGLSPLTISLGEENKIDILNYIDNFLKEKNP